MEIISWRYKGRLMITVFTPTYNRARLLSKLYSSLKQQTSLDFEWLIVDDGSQDDTKCVVEDFIKECDKFPIRYYLQENHGKHVAINYGVQLAHGEMFFIVDSDDWLPSNAIERIRSFFAEIKGLNGYAGVAGLKLYSNGNIVGGTFGGKCIDCTTLERAKNSISGDKAEVFYTELLRRYPFPVFDGENFLSEEVVWNRIARDGYKFRWFNEGLYYCEYLEGGLSKTSNKELNNFNGYKIVIKELLTYKEIPFKRKVISLMIIGEISLRKKANLKDVAKEINVNIATFTFLAYLGKIIRKIRRWRRKDEES